MNLLSAHWEKIVLGIVCVLFVAVVAMSLLGKSTTEEFSASKQIKTVQGADESSGIPGLAKMAATPAPTALLPDSFAHPWLQHSTALIEAVIPLNSKICIETGNEVMYKEDADGDGMPNKWEDKWGLNWIDPSDGVLDKDGDGFTNAEEFTLETDPTDPTDPNVVDEEYRLVEVYRPKRLIKLRNVAKGSAKPLQFSVKVGKRSSTKFQKSGDTITNGKEDLYLIGEFTEIKTNIYKASIKKSIEEDISQVEVTDLKTGKTFALIRNKDSFEDYVEAKIVNKENGDILVLKEGEELPVAKLKKNVTATKFDEEAKTGTFSVGKVKYTLKSEK